MRGITVVVERASADRLTLAYTIGADPGQIRIPERRAPRIGQQLWKHTCCECFIAAKGQSAYHEYNFSPSREWAVYAFSNYREGAPVVDEALDPGIEVRRLADRLELAASIALQPLRARCGDGPLAIGLSAMIEDAHGRLSYWALRHPAGQPDFHHRDSFTLEL